MLLVLLSSAVHGFVPGVVLPQSQRGCSGRLSAPPASVRPALRRWRGETFNDSLCAGQRERGAFARDDASFRFFPCSPCVCYGSPVLPHSQVWGGSTWRQETATTRLRSPGPIPKTGAHFVQVGCMPLVTCLSHLQRRVRATAPACLCSCMCAHHRTQTALIERGIQMTQDEADSPSSLQGAGARERAGARWSEI